jgi:hypothetical protein
MTKDVQKQTTFDEIYFTDRENESGDLFSFAEYPVACYGDEGEENPP